MDVIKENIPKIGQKFYEMFSKIVKNIFSSEVMLNTL